MDAHFPGNQPVDDTVVLAQQGVSEQLSIPSENWDLASQIVSLDRMEWAIKRFEPYKAPGPDAIHPIIVQKGWNLLKVQLYMILRACLAIGYIPNAWRNVKVVFIPKPGKDEYDDAKSYRPISLTSVFLKILERLVDRFLRSGALKEAKLHKNQHAYQTGKSTETALHSLISRIEHAVYRNEYALGVFFDIQGAFDNAPTDVIEKALETKGAHRIVCRWISSMLRFRRVTASLDEPSVTVATTGGCPQGGVLSPIL